MRFARPELQRPQKDNDGGGRLSMPVAAGVAGMLGLILCAALIALPEGSSGVQGDGAGAEQGKEVFFIESEKEPCPQTCSVVLQSDDFAVDDGDEVATKLENKGYQVQRLGNCDIYESLVVYRSHAFEDEAKQIAEIAGGAQILRTSVGYDYPSDVLVLVGNKSPLNSRGEPRTPHVGVSNLSR